MIIKTVSNGADILYKPGDVIGFDIETSPKGGLVSDGREVLLDPRLQRIVLAQLSIGDTVYILRSNFESLKILLEDETIVKVIHNASFECKFMMHLNVHIKNIFDTMLVEGIVENGHIPQLSLDAITKKYLKVKLNKVIRQKFVHGDVVDDSMLRYAAEDAFVLPQIHSILIRSPEFVNQQRVVKLEHALIPVSSAIEYNGIGFDVLRWKAIADASQKEFSRVKKEFLESIPTQSTRRISVLGDMVTDDNINSREFILSIFRSVGIDLPDLKSLTIRDALLTYKHPLLRLYVQYTKLVKRVTTYGLPFLNYVNPVTKRVHQRINQLVARTGRLSGSKPNMMNIPKTADYRSCFVAPKGRMLVGCDYSQQEYRILAEVSRDAGLIEAFEQGIDVHIHTARKLFHDPTIDKDDPRRKLAKNINFGLIYGMGSKKLSRELGCSTSEAKELMTAHSREFRQAFAWTNDTINFARVHGYVETLLGRKRYLDTSGMDYERQARNTPIQGSAADMTKLALVVINKTVPGMIVNVVHDEICIECDVDDVNECQNLVEKGMLKGAHALVKHVPFDVNSYVSKIWVKES